jgi:pimeloyl-ACP methyl ester carboxylesterase
MSKPEVLIQAVVIEGLSYGQTAARYNVSKTLVHRLHHRWLVEGDNAFLPRSSRPRSSPDQTTPEVATRILQLREELTRQGLDAGAEKIWATIDCPVRATKGDRDVFVTACDFVSLAKVLPTITLPVVSDCGHFGSIERPREILTALGFLGFTVEM